MVNLHFEPFPVLETERLILRKAALTDVADLFSLRTDPKTMKFIPRVHPKTHDDVLEMMKNMYDENSSINWAITLKPSTKLIGMIGFYRTQKEHFRSEVGYMISSDYWGIGIATEALGPILDFGFNEIKLHSIEARINPKNIASRGVLLKHQFVKEGYFKDEIFFNNVFEDSEVYSLLNS